MRFSLGTFAWERGTRSAALHSSWTLGQALEYVKFSLGPFTWEWETSAALRSSWTFRLRTLVCEV